MYVTPEHCKPKKYNRYFTEEQLICSERCQLHDGDICSQRLNWVDTGPRSSHSSMTIKGSIRSDGEKGFTRALKGSIRFIQIGQSLKVGGEGKNVEKKSSEKG
jgi:hypothetical protein